jgi:predicted DNA-binding protein (UPF0251 family)
LRSRIIRLERELRNKDLNLSKLQFDLKTTDVNELKLALNIYSDELTRLRLLKDDQLAQTSNKIQAERKMQISQLKNALTKLAKVGFLEGRELKVVNIIGKLHYFFLKNIKG